jgi:outer membrane receptor for ferrienterochelin and colicins
MLNGMLRTFYRGEKIRAQFNVQGIRQEINGGQVGFDENPTDLYGFNLETDRVEAFGKIGYIGFENQFASLGWITNATWHKNDGFFGNNQYDATQRSLYTNLIYQNILGSTNHNYKLGASYIYDNYDEVFAGEDYSLIESVPGAFVEYDFSKSKKVTKNDIEKERSFGLIVGLRADYHNQFGLFVTPRLSMKYNFDEKTVVRFNAGRGYRTARILAENISTLTSARTINVLEDLDAEEAWNIGLNFTKNFNAFDKEVVFSTDLYSTHFTNQIVMDRETAADEIQFYNLDGQSFSNNFLATIGVNLTEYLEVKLSYKYNDVKVTFNGELLQTPLVAKHRGLVTASLNSLDDTWKLHTTVQVVGPQRLPQMSHANHSSAGHESLADYHLFGQSPTFATVNAQLTKVFGKWEFYIGGENLTNYMQHNPIIGATDPFNNDEGIPVFDASQIFAPIMGTVGYAGFRFTLK